MALQLINNSVVTILSVFKVSIVWCNTRSRAKLVWKISFAASQRFLGLVLSSTLGVILFWCSRLNQDLIFKALGDFWAKDAADFFVIGSSKAHTGKKGILVAQLKTHISYKPQMQLRIVLANINIGSGRAVNEKKWQMQLVLGAMRHRFA